MKRLRSFIFIASAILLTANIAAGWSEKLKQELAAIDQRTPGQLGVYVKKIGSAEEVDYPGVRNWYFASVVKVPVAVAVLQLLQEGKLRLSDTVVLTKAFFRDGSGEVQFKKVGSKLTVSYLLEKMLTQSDSTATDMLVDLIGVDALNLRIKNNMGVDGFHPFTSILQVRKDAFAQLHPKAAALTNLNFIELKNHKSATAKYAAVAKMLNIPKKELRAPSVNAAFEKYYASNLNSGTLKAYGQFLEKLAVGHLLSKENTDLIMKHMTSMVTGNTRVKAGLPKTVRFAQKTGTQVERICNVGIASSKIEPSKTEPSKSVVIVVCLEKFGNFADAERTMKKVGQAITPLL